MQATIGPCNVPRPSSWKAVEQSKWKRFVCFAHRLLVLLLDLYLVCSCVLVIYSPKARCVIGEVRDFGKLEQKMLRNWKRDLLE